MQLAQRADNCPAGYQVGDPAGVEAAVLCRLEAQTLNMQPVEQRFVRHGKIMTAAGVSAVVYQPSLDEAELPNRIPEAPPYILEEANFFPPPFEEYWQGVNNPGQCVNCHKRIFEEWSGSMMANAWRDPAWRSAFLLSARQTSTHGECDTPSPPDGTCHNATTFVSLLLYQGTGNWMSPSDPNTSIRSEEGESV